MGVYMKQLESADLVYQLVLRRSRLFGKYGERFDKRLYAENEAYVRIYMQLSDHGFVKNDPKTFRKLLKIQGKMLKRGSRRYDQFP